MKKYFRFIGILLLALFVALLIYIIFKSIKGELPFNFFEIAFFIIVSPSAGLLFLVFANHLEEHEQDAIRQKELLRIELEKKKEQESADKVENK